MGGWGGIAGGWDVVCYVACTWCPICWASPAEVAQRSGWGSRCRCKQSHGNCFLWNLRPKTTTAWSCMLDLYAIEILPCSWLTFLRLAWRGAVACAQGQTVTDDICAGVYQWNSNLRIIGILGSGRERQHQKFFHILQQQAFFALDLREQLSLMSASLSPRIGHEKFQLARATRIIKAKVVRSKKAAP